MKILKFDDIINTIIANKPSNAKYGKVTPRTNEGLVKPRNKGSVFNEPKSSAIV